MFDRAINKRNNNSFKNNEKKFIIWFNLEKNIEKKYNPQNFQELLDDTKKCYKELKKPNEIYYEKKKLELKINNRFNNISLSQYFSNLLTLFALFFATIISIYAGLKFNDDATKNKNLLIMLKWSWIPIVILMILSFLVFVGDIILSSNLKRNFNLFCLGIIEDIEKEMDMEDNIVLDQVASTKICEDNINKKSNFQMRKILWFININKIKFDKYCEMYAHLLGEEIPRYEKENYIELQKIVVIKLDSMNLEDKKNYEIFAKDKVVEFSGSTDYKPFYAALFSILVIFLGATFKFFSDNNTFENYKIMRLMLLLFGVTIIWCIIIEFISDIKRRTKKGFYLWILTLLDFRNEKIK